MNLRVSGRAKARIRDQDDWWRKHRLDAPDLFKEELAIVIETVWGARRGRGPKL